MRLTSFQVLSFFYHTLIGCCHSNGLDIFLQISIELSPAGRTYRVTGMLIPVGQVLFFLSRCDAVPFGIGIPVSVNAAQQFALVFKYNLSFIGVGFGEPGEYCNIDNP